jgi:hypothetical protein
MIGIGTFNLETDVGFAEEFRLVNYKKALSKNQ